jgi:hypothetical protein
MVGIVVGKANLNIVIPEFCAQIAIYEVRDQFAVIDSER